jgi:tetratricopeptide (TPR) repeat protein
MSLKSERELGPGPRSLVTRAKAAQQSKNYDYTINLLQSVLKEEPLYLDGRRFLRTVEILKYKELSAFSRQMLSMKVSTAAMKLSSAGKKEATEQLVLAEEVLALDPFHNKANTLVGDAGTKLGYPEFRAFAFETLAHEALTGGKAKQSDKAILNTLANTYMELNDPVKAEKTYQRILEIDPRDGDALSGLKNASAAHASRSGGWEMAGADYRNALKNKTEAEELEQASKVVKSEEAIEEQIQLNFAKHTAQPTNPVHSRAIARLFEQKNDLASAIVWYEEAFNAGHRVDTALEKVIGDLKLKKAEQDLAAFSAMQAEEADPDLKAQYLAAIEEKQKEIMDVRLSQAEARVRAHPNDGQYHYEFGEALYKAGQYKRATEELQVGMKQPSVRYQAMNYMGLSFMQRGMLDFAVKYFALAESELPVMDDLKKEIVYNLGLAYEATSHPEKALDQWKKIYEVDMGYRDVASKVEASYGT